MYIVAKVMGVQPPPLLRRSMIRVSVPSRFISVSISAKRSEKAGVRRMASSGSSGMGSDMNLL